MFRRNVCGYFRAGLLVVSLQASAQINVLTANYDSRRTNVNQFETILTPAKIRAGGFGKLAGFPVTGQIYAQPLYAGAVQTAAGPKNIVFVATMHNNVYAIDADNLSSTDPLWQAQLGDPVPSTVDIKPEIGILSTPVIDLMRQALYVVSATLDNNV